MGTVQGKTVAFFVAPEGVEQDELTAPWRAVAEAEGTPRLMSTRSGWAQAFNCLDHGDTFAVDGAPVLAGRLTKPDALRQEAAAVAFVRGCFQAGRPDGLPASGEAFVAEFARTTA